MPFSCTVSPHPPSLFARAALAVAVGLLCLAPRLSAQQGSRGIEHTWSRVYYGELDGRERLLFGGGFERAKPALGDLDGDGDQDLVIGTARGNLIYFENRGSSAAPVWRLVSEGLPAEHPAAAGSRRTVRKGVNVEENAAPALADIDGDGDLDLFVGSAAGKLYFYRNAGNRYLATFFLESSDFLGAPFGRNLVARFADLNDDGLPDLAVGNAEGAFYVIMNRGSPAVPIFCTSPQVEPPDCLTPARKLGQLDPEDNAVPGWVDWDGDGDMDLVVGKSDGRVALYRNVGDRRRGSWELASPRFKILDIGGYSAPAFGDLTGDGRPDLLLAGDGDQISYYINRPDPAGAELWLEEKNVLGAIRLGRFQSRLHAASGDLNGDGKPDLVMGTRGGRLLLYANVGGKGRVALRSMGEPLLPTPKRAYSAPALADLDGDGDLDLAVGDRNGRLEIIENIGTRKKARWRVVDVFFGQIDVGSMSTPVFHDYDGDGDADLLVGNSLGNLVFYQNQGTRDRPGFLLRSIRFAGMKMAAAASPAIFRYDTKLAPDIVLGARAGTLHSAVRNPSVPISEPLAYQRQAEPWRGIRARAFSAPHFVDLTGDGRADLLLGSGDGTLALWRYEGAQAGGRALRPALADRRRNIVPGGEPRRELRGAGAGPRETALLLPLDRGLIALDPIFTREPDAVEKLAVGRQSKPVFFDADGDGRLDLLVGTRAGRLLFFKNRPGAGGVRWGKPQTNFAGYRHGRNAAPAVTDIDGDGDQDLVVGTEEGRVYLWENTGTRKKAQWRARPEAFASVRAGKNAVPAFADLDGDGKTDLLVGNLRGQLQFYRREPGKALNFKLVSRRFLGLDVGINSSPVFARLTGRRAPVLLVGSDRGRIAVRIAEGGAWKANKSFVESLKFPLGSHPALADLDGDGDQDLYVGSERGPISLYRNNALVPETPR